MERCIRGPVLVTESHNAGGGLLGGDAQFIGFQRDRALGPFGGAAVYPFQNFRIDDRQGMRPAMRCQRSEMGGCEIGC
jgi:hypothetical protein